MSTVFVFAPALGHTKTGHPEGKHRLAGLMPFLDGYGVLGDVVSVEPTYAELSQLSDVHSLGLIELVRQTAQRGGGFLDYGDTYATAVSYDLARLAAGGCITAVDGIMSGAHKNGFALVRPPGHHAEIEHISGFCLFNNVAIAARHAQKAFGVKRVLIVDFDVHHGNGTQDIFYKDDSVLFVSTHLFIPRMFYPGTGAMQETGLELGAGYTLNAPLAPHVGDQGYARIFEEIILPKARAFQPELILVSAGYDAHWKDPLAMAGLSLRGYATISQLLVSLANELCDGRILFVLEGGYYVDALSYGILNTLHALLGQDQVEDPLGKMPDRESDVESLLTNLKQRHLIY